MGVRMWPRWAAGLSLVVVATGWLTLSTPGPRAAGTPSGDSATPAAASPVAAAASPAVARVEIEDDTFRPLRLRVPVGTAVLWRNRDARAHTVTAEDGAFDSGRLAYRAGFRLTFAEPGVYGYQCDYHNDMSGTITVE